MISIRLHRHFRAVLIAAAAMIGAFSAIPAVYAAEMIYVQRAGCPWCRVVDQTVVPIWNKTAEGQRAPLRNVDSDQPWPEDLAGIVPEKLTPTFILMEDGKEIARLRGYPGDHFFWPMIAEMIAKLPEPPAGETN